VAVPVTAVNANADVTLMAVLATRSDAHLLVLAAGEVPTTVNAHAAGSIHAVNVVGTPLFHGPARYPGGHGAGSSRSRGRPLTAR